MTAPSPAVTVGKVATAATVVTATVSPTSRLFAARNARVARPGMVAGACRVGTVRSSSPPIGVLGCPGLAAAADPYPGSNVIVHAPRTGSDTSSEGGPDLLVTPKNSFSAVSAGEEGVASQPDRAAPAAVLTDSTLNVAGCRDRAAGSW